MSETVNFQFTGDERDLLRSFDKMQDRLQKTEEQLRRIKQGSDDAGDSASDFGDKAKSSMQEFAGQIVGITSVMGGALAVVEAMRAEYEHLKQIRGEAAATQAAVGELMTGPMVNAPPEDRAALPEQLNRLSRETNALMEVVSPVVAQALASRGALSTEQSMEASAIGLELYPTDAGSAGQLTSRVQQLMNITGNPDAAIAAGFLLQVQGGVPVKDLSQFGSNIAPGLTGMMSGGASPEIAGEFAQVIGTALGDQTGAVTKTAMQTLQAELRDFKAAGSDSIAYYEAADDWERIRVIQGSAALQAQAEQQMQFPMESRNALLSILRGDPDKLAMIASAQANVTPYGSPEHVGAFPQLVADLQGTPEGQHFQTRQATLVATQQGYLAMDEAAIRGEVDNIVDAVLNQVDTPWSLDSFMGLGSEDRLRGRINMGDIDQQGRRYEGGSPENAIFQLTNYQRNFDERSPERELLGQAVANLQKLVSNTGTPPSQPVAGMHDRHWDGDR